MPRGETKGLKGAQDEVGEYGREERAGYQCPESVSIFVELLTSTRQSAVFIIGRKEFNYGSTTPLAGRFFTLRASSRPFLLHPPFLPFFPPSTPFPRLQRLLLSRFPTFCFFFTTLPATPLPPIPPTRHCQHHYCEDISRG